MLDNVFLEICNMSFTALYIIPVVIFVRLLLVKAPKIFSYTLWSVVLFRLLCPLTFESVFSVFSIRNTPAENIRPFPETFYTPNTGDVVVDTVPLKVLESFAETVEPLFTNIFTLIWLIGVAFMVVYSVVSVVKLRRKLIGATPVSKNIFVADHINSPFVMGFFSPKIYLPSNLTDSEQEFVISHEETHIKRFDHITRILAFVALSFHWFNPLVWLAFILSGRDMETSCDEAVMKKMTKDVRADYSEALLKFATGRKIIHGTPLAFGEGDTKSRIINVMKYKKPVVWLSGICVILVGGVGISLISNAKEEFDEPPTIYAYYENGVVPMNLGTYSWVDKGILTSTGVESDSISYIDMDYENAITYNENKGWRNANIILSLDNEPADWNSDNVKWNDDIKIVGMKRFVNGEEEILTNFDKNWVLVQLETDGVYLYEFKIQFGDDSYGYYSVQIENNTAFTNTGSECEDIEIGMAKEDVIAQFGEPVLVTEATFGNIYYVADRQIAIYYDDEKVDDVKITPNLTVDDLIRLSSKGEDLSLEDFEDFSYYVTGSGLQVQVYYINGDLEFITDGVYMRLCDKTEPEHFIDIRTGDVGDFISKYGNGGK